jgi:hypothetical protein
MKSLRLRSVVFALVVVRLLATLSPKLRLTRSFSSVRRPGTRMGLGGTMGTNVIVRGIRWHWVGIVSSCSDGPRGGVCQCQ